MIVDAHAHIFETIRGTIGEGPITSLEGGKVRFGGTGRVINFFHPAASEIRFTPEMLMECMEQAGVDRAVLLQGPFYGDMNEYVWCAIQRWPERLTGAAYLDLWAPDSQEQFHRAIDQMRFRIVKLELSEATGLAGLYPALRLDDAALDWFWNEVHRRQIVVVLDLGHIGGKAYQTHAVERIVNTYRGLRIVIAHLAQPPISHPTDKNLERLWEQQVRLAHHPTVWLDMASLPNYGIAAGEDYPYATVRRYLRRAVELVGPSKILWGSDIPATLLNNTYSQLLDCLRRHCRDFLDSADMARILGDNAVQVYWS